MLGPAGEQSYILVDVRSTDDGYMPEDWCHRLLSRRVPHKMFHVLPPRDYFVSLLYHVVAHKGVMTPDYARRLVDLAAAAGVDTDLARIGDFREACRIFAEEGVEISKPRDGSVLPKLPYLDPPASVVSSRILDVVDGRPYVSRVAFVEKDGRPIVRKQTTFELAEREHALLSLLDSDHFPKPISARCATAPPSVCEMERVDGYPLSDLERFVAETSPEGAQGVPARVPRDPRRARGPGHHAPRYPPDNILVRDGRPGPDRLRLGDLGGASLRDAGRTRGRRPRAGGLLRRLRDGRRPHAGLRALSRAPARARRHDAALGRRARHRSHRPSALVDAGAPSPAEVAAAVCRIAEQAIASGALEPANAALERALDLASDDAALLAAAGTVRLALGEDGRGRGALRACWSRSTRGT